MENSQLKEQVASYGSKIASLEKEKAELSSEISRIQGNLNQRGMFVVGWCTQVEESEVTKLKNELDAALKAIKGSVASSPEVPKVDSPVVARTNSTPFRSSSASAPLAPATEGGLVTSPTVKKFGNISPKCEICGKSVYHAEKYMDNNKIFHTQYDF